MTRSRKLEYVIFSYIRAPLVLSFNLLPAFLARLLLRWFRFSETSLAYGIRYLCVKRLAKKAGNKIIISPACMLYWLENCEFGENISLNDFTYIDAVGGIKIGNDVRIAHNCSLITGQHRYDQPGKTIFDSGSTQAPIVIEDDVWLGTGVVILKGVTVGKGSVVAANAVVNKDVKPYTIVGGVPAKFIKNRF